MFKMINDGSNHTKMKESYIKSTINFYEEHAADYVEETCLLDMSKMQNKFLEKLPLKANILDLGCGSGRDLKYFNDLGYLVDAIDGSREMCNIAKTISGINVRHMEFKSLDKMNKYNGIWACASILHLNKDDLLEVMKKMIDALRNSGIIYASFKYGEFEGIRDGRFYTDMTCNTLKTLLEKVDGLVVDEICITVDVREDRSNEKWLNVFLKKNENFRNEKSN